MTVFAQILVATNAAMMAMSLVGTIGNENLKGGGRVIGYCYAVHCAASGFVLWSYAT